MAQFSERVVKYPVISDSLKIASDAYTWVSSGERFKKIFLLSEQAANKLKEKASLIANTDAVSQLDAIACTQILNRIEAVFPSVNKPTEELFGPIADRSLTAAESYFESCLPNTADKPPLSRYERLMRLQTALRNSEKVQKAEETVSASYKLIQDHFNSMISLIKPSGHSTQSQTDNASHENLFTSLSNTVLQYQHAAAIAFPKFNTLIDGAINQSQALITELRQSENLNHFGIHQLRAIVNGLHNTLSNLNEHRESWMKSLLPESKKEQEEGSELATLSSQTTYLSVPSEADESSSESKID